MHPPTLADQISLGSLITSIIVGISSLAVSIYALRTARKNTLSRVEFDELSTGTNGPDYNNGWTPWRSGIYIGVQRKIDFYPTFKQTPKTSGNFFLLQLNPAKQIAETIGYKLIGEERIRLEGLHAVCWFDVNVKQDWMILQVGVGLTNSMCDSLEPFLGEYQPTEEEISYAKKNRSIMDRETGLTESERWMLGFSNIVGHLGVNWVARENHE